jgi:hypothetical protein
MAATKDFSSKNPPIELALWAAFLLCFAGTPLLRAQAPPKPASPKETLTTTHAAGPFEVKTTPQDDKVGDPTLGRLLLEKQYHGDFEGIGKGQMLTAGSVAKGSGAYVAIERVTGTLKGRTGSFTLQHSGIMNNGVPQLAISIVPGSGTGELAGIAGKMTINFAPGGKHSYELEYTLPKTD